MLEGFRGRIDLVGEGQGNFNRREGICIGL